MLRQELAVILDNVGFHKSERAEELVKAQGAWLLFLPPYSPDLSPIEMAFFKLKTLLRNRAARSFDAIAQALGDICNLSCVDNAASTSRLPDMRPIKRDKRQDTQATIYLKTWAKYHAPQTAGARNEA